MTNATIPSTTSIEAGNQEIAPLQNLQRNHRGGKPEFGKVKKVWLHVLELRGKSIGYMYECRVDAERGLREGVESGLSKYQLSVVQKEFEAEDLYFIGDHPEEGPIWELLVNTMQTKLNDKSGK